MRLTLLLALFAVPLIAVAKPSACPEHYAGGTAPVIAKASLAAKTRELCNGGYAVMHSGVSRTPLWAAEKLTSERVQAAWRMERHDAFHADERLPPAERSELADYEHTGFDRGHMAPSGDMPDLTSQEESFALSNMVPQDPQNNRFLWGDIESAVRNLAVQRGELYVLTGPLFRGSAVKRLHGRVMVPTDVFKVVFDPQAKTAGAYLAPNDSSGAFRRMSVAELEQLAGIKLLPGLSPQQKATGMVLPAPNPHSRDR